MAENKSPERQRRASKGCKVDVRCLPLMFVAFGGSALKGPFRQPGPQARDSGPRGNPGLKGRFTIAR